MTIIADMREQKNRHILDYFDKAGVKHIRQKLNCGDYAIADRLKVCIERKADLSEVCGNLGQGKARFYREFDRAKINNAKLILLIEHGSDIKALSDVANWQNPRLIDSPRALTGRELMERLHKLKMVFGIDILFCNKQDTGKRIIELLGDDFNVHK